MEITLKDKNGVILHTAKKHCKEDISIKIDTREIIVTPSNEEQVKEGLFNKITVTGDADLKPENIKVGTNIFGVEGGFNAVDTRDATATSNDILEGTTAYVNNLKVEGNVPNNGELDFEPSDEEQIIPAGLTSGGAVKAADITKLAEYEACLTLANSVDNLGDYTDTTATAEDIREGKTAYSNGERITGTMPAPFDTSMITRGSSIFEGNKDIIELPDIEFPLCIWAYKMAKDCTSLKTVGNLKFPNMRDACFDYDQGWFYGCTSLEKIGNIELTLVYTSGINGKCLLYGLTNLKEIGDITFPYIKNAQGLFYNCQQLNKIGTLDFSAGLLTNMQEMFWNCPVLEYIPIFDTSKVTTFYNAFKNCISLNDEALNNILYMLTNSGVTIASYKTLAHTSLTSAQATRCQSLSNYQAFIDAGWTTGY